MSWPLKPLAALGRWWRREERSESGALTPAEAQRICALDALVEASAARLRRGLLSPPRAQRWADEGPEELDARRAEEEALEGSLLLLEEAAGLVLGRERKALWRARGGLPWREALQRLLVTWLQLPSPRTPPFSALLASQLEELGLPGLPWNEGRSAVARPAKPPEGILIITLALSLAGAMALGLGAQLGLLAGLFAGIALQRRPAFRCPAARCGRRCPRLGRCPRCGIELILPRSSASLSSPISAPHEAPEPARSDDSMRISGAPPSPRAPGAAPPAPLRPSEPGLILYPGRGAPPERAPEHAPEQTPEASRGSER